jgi:hypothetical protein
MMSRGRSRNQREFEARYLAWLDGMIEGHKAAVDRGKPRPAKELGPLLVRLRGFEADRARLLASRASWPASLPRRLLQGLTRALAGARLLPPTGKEA